MNVMWASNEQNNRRPIGKKQKIEPEKVTKSTESTNQKPLQQTSIVASFNSDFKAVADAAVTVLFYVNGLSFSVIKIKYCKEAF